jgi:2-methylisocitrate lyase-like PEP mutase family enzyme
MPEGKIVKSTNRLRDLLDSPRCVLAPGVYNALSAKQVEHEGFDALYVTGFGTAASLGYPDVGLVTQTEMVTNLRYICQSVSIPVIADADTGYGNPVNVVRTVREYEQAGVAAFHMEDQVFPKKCGFFEGKQVVALEEHVQKVRAAVDARSDPHLVIIARTDALAVNGWDDVVRRCHAYRDAGADLVFVDGIKTTEDLITYSDLLAKKGVPCLYNGELVSIEEASDRGFKVQIIAGLALSAIYRATVGAMQALVNTGSADAYIQHFETPPPGDGFNELLGLPAVYEIERRYVTASEPVA